ncbi:hypothetical protein C7M84_024214 [Penaeus vannamei]|uniref:Uncharacterized protein n=1 Tax=Penaeus vannamei TaxID=6689 RepID=A0A3R7NBI8_PENVA|nr:hypothetical protein C7M84_024214 [Penaeus vannamei]
MARRSEELSALPEDTAHRHKTQPINTGLEPPQSSQNTTTPASTDANHTSQYGGVRYIVCVRREEGGGGHRGPAWCAPAEAPRRTLGAGGRGRPFPCFLLISLFLRGRGSMGTGRGQEERRPLFPSLAFPSPSLPHAPSPPLPRAPTQHVRIPRSLEGDERGRTQAPSDVASGECEPASLPRRASERQQTGKSSTRARGPAEGSPPPAARYYHEVMCLTYTEFSRGTAHPRLPRYTLPTAFATTLPTIHSLPDNSYNATTHSLQHNYNLTLATKQPLLPRYKTLAATHPLPDSRYHIPTTHSLSEHCNHIPATTSSLPPRHHSPATSALRPINAPQNQTSSQNHHTLLSSVPHACHGSYTTTLTTTITSCSTTYPSLRYQDESTTTANANPVPPGRLKSQCHRCHHEYQANASNFPP